MKKALLLFCGLLMYAHAQATNFETAKDALVNMGVGWNLGNTLDAQDMSKTWTTTEQHETCWGQPVTKPGLLKMMKEAGFGAIRVPVTWYQEMDSNGQVNDAWMKRVKEVVDYVIDNGMYCILNVHHDTGEGNQAWLIADEENYTKNKSKYENLWKQIATTFKDYDQRLLFESYNEMLDKAKSWCYPSFNTSSKYDAIMAKSAYNAINSYAQSFVNTVRATGGNNACRNLVVNTYAASCGSGNWNEHLQDPLKEMKLPTDEVSNHLIFQVHAYPGLRKDNLSSIKDEVKAMMNDLKSILAAKGAPVIIGEWGTINDDSDVNYQKNRENYLDFCRYFVEEAKKNDIVTFYWMGLSNGPNRDLPAFNQPDLAETIVKAYRGSDYIGSYPAPGDFQVEYVVNYNDQWSELFLYGDWNNSSPFKLSDYKGIRIELDNDSHLSDLQVKLYGRTDGQEDYPKLTGSVSTILFADSQEKIGNEITKITLQKTISDPLTIKVKSATLIKADDTETPGDIKVAWGCTMTTESTPVSGIHQIKAVYPENDRIYNLNGQHIISPSKGIYIKNGKKYVKK